MFSSWVFAYFAIAALALPALIAWGDACERSSAGTRRCLDPASNGRFTGSAGRHHATGRWRAALARHPRYAVFGIGAGTAVLAGLVMVTLPGHSVRPGAEGCGLVTCGSTLPPFSATASPPGRQPTRTATPGVLPSPMPQVASAAAPRTRTAGPRPKPTRHRPHSHPTPPSSSHPAKPA